MRIAHINQSTYLEDFSEQEKKNRVIESHLYVRTKKFSGARFTL